MLWAPFYPSPKKSQLASNFKLTRTPTIYGEHGIMAHIIMAKPIKTLELHYQMIQFLIIAFILKDILPSRTLFEEDLSAAGNKKKLMSTS